MASGVNKAILVGNVGRDPEIRTTSTGVRSANFSLATNETWIDKATKKRREKIEWHSISIYGDGIVGIVEKLVRKGSKLYLEGTIHTRKWRDVETNAPRSAVEIVLQGYNCTLIILDKKSDENNDMYTNTPEQERDSSDVEENDMRSDSTQQSHLESEEDSIPF